VEIYLLPVVPAVVKTRRLVCQKNTQLTSASDKYFWGHTFNHVNEQFKLLKGFTRLYRLYTIYQDYRLQSRAMTLLVTCEGETMRLLSEIRPINLREQVVEQVKTAIIEGRLKPGDHMVEATLTKQLGVSRTPLREALILLEREGLVESFPNRGTFVRRFDVRDVSAIFSMRIALENFAADLIIKTLDQSDFERLEGLIEEQRRYIRSKDFKHVRTTDMSFHRYLIERSEHPLLIRNWSEIVAQIAALLYMRAEALPNYNESLAIADHKKILEAYKAKNLAKVKALNKQINERVEGECKESLAAISQVLKAARASPVRKSKGGLVRLSPSVSR
jgi:DNA-binding GntR family transcriptional regulator